MKKLVVLALLSASGRSDTLVSDPPPACVMRVSRITNSRRAPSGDEVRGVHPKQYIPLQIGYRTLTAPPDFDDGTASNCGAQEVTS
jgi:hypothetical protein